MRRPAGVPRVRRLRLLRLRRPPPARAPRARLRLHRPRPAPPRPPVRVLRRSIGVPSDGQRSVRVAPKERAFVAPVSRFETFVLPFLATRRP
eukprot:3198589-Pyramimonas_sp.AAC.2